MSVAIIIRLNIRSTHDDRTETELEKQTVSV